MIACDTDRPEIPGLRYLAPPLALGLMLAGAAAMALLFVPGLVFPCLDQQARMRRSALFRYRELCELIARGAVYGKAKCVLTSETFRWSPRLAGLIYRHFGKMTLLVLLGLALLLSRGR
ncbi:MAG: hypothetical protein HY926_01780 [Elusimicrobia bacterium]|nr:hypothetical protein [Elusimicrobiota bacterium]